MTEPHVNDMAVTVHQASLEGLAQYDNAVGAHVYVEPLQTVRSSSSPLAVLSHEGFFSVSISVLKASFLGYKTCGELNLSIQGLHVSPQQALAMHNLLADLVATGAFKSDCHDGPFLPLASGADSPGPFHSVVAPLVEQSLLEVTSGNNACRLTASGLHRLCYAWVLQDCHQVLIPRQDVPLKEQTSWELVCTLEERGWTHAPLKRKAPSYSVGSDKIWYYGKNVSRLYLLALLLAEEVAAPIPHGKGVAVYKALIEGKKPPIIGRGIGQRGRLDSDVVRPTSTTHRRAPQAPRQAQPQPKQHAHVSRIRPKLISRAKKKKLWPGLRNEIGQRASATSSTVGVAMEAPSLGVPAIAKQGAAVSEESPLSLQPPMFLQECVCKTRGCVCVCVGGPIVNVE